MTFQSKTMTYKKIVYLLAFMLVLLNPAAEAASKDRSKDVFYLNVFYKNAKPTDTLTLRMENIVFALGEEKGNDFHSSVAKDGYFRFEIPIQQGQGLFSLWKNKTLSKTSGRPLRMLATQFWEAGDSLSLDIDYTEGQMSAFVLTNYKFSGRGFEKYNLMRRLNNLKLDKADSASMNAIFAKRVDKQKLPFEEFESVSAFTLRKLNILNEYRHLLSDISYNVIKADIIYADQLLKMTEVMVWLLKSDFNDMDDQIKKRIKNVFNNAISTTGRYGISPEGLRNSTGYFKFLVGSMGVFNTASIVNFGTISVDQTFDFIKKYPSDPIIKETLVMLLLWRLSKYPDNVDAIFKEAKLYVTNPIYLKLLSDSHLKCINKNLSDFELEDTNGLTTSYKDFKNKVLIMDFWFTGCGACSSYYKNVLSKVKERFKNNPNVIFLSISIDKDKANWKRSVAKEIYTSKDAVNVYTNGLGSNHMLVKQNNIKAFPCVVLLDKNGNLKLYNSKDLYQSDSFIESIKNLL